jgi:single-stranded-DNA-specific exonuclease
VKGEVKVAVQKEWILVQQPDRATVTEIADGTGIHTRVASVLASRGFDAESARKFLNPSLGDLHDPLSMNEMDKAAERVVRAIRENEPVVIHGDYDVDGISGVALLYLFLKRHGCHVYYYIPNRIDEGYGLSSQGVMWSAEKHAGLLITVDTGTTDLDEIELAVKSGMDVIVADHHEPGPDMPRAYAILNPKRRDAEYPFSELSGCGVAYKLRQAIALKLGEESEDDREDLDLVALATVCDVVPMIDENRVLAKFGIETLRDTKRAGIIALKDVARLREKELNVYHLGFVLGPRLNAAGRIASASESVKLLTTESLEEAEMIANRLDAQNRKRKELNEKIFGEASAMVEEHLDLSTTAGIVLASSDWHEGVIGIVASKIAERYHRPTIIISTDGEEGRGSGRSVSGVSLYEALLRCADTLQDFGGHEQAAGLTITPENIPAFRERFDAAVREQVSIEELVPRIRVDAELRVSDIDEHLFSSLELMRPFGISNSRPVFLSEATEVVGFPAIVGKSHLKFRVRDGAAVQECIGFWMGERLDTVVLRPKIDLVYGVHLDEYLGRRKFSLHIKDFRAAQ